MSKRFKGFTLLAAGLFLGACGDHDPLSPPAEVGPAQAALVWGETVVPITWTYVVSPVYDENTIECPGGVDFPVNWTMEGQLTHLGRLDHDGSTATFTSCDAGTDPELGLYYAGGAVLHLAGPQGDAVDLEGTLTLWLMAGYATGDWDIVGGAGRFAGAHGHIDTVEYPSEDGMGSAGSGTGTITQPQPVRGGR